MNILFLTHGHVSKTRGGIDRVTDVLANSLMKRGHQVYLISVCNPLENDMLETYQYVLPQQTECNQENLDYLSDFLSQKKIGIIINQSEKYAILELSRRVKGNIPLVSVFHTDPLSLIKGLRDGWDYWRMYEKRWKFISLFPYYVLRHGLRYYLRRKSLIVHHKYFYESSEGIVLLSERFKQPFLKLIGKERSDKLFSISNPLSYEEKDGVKRQNKEKIILFVARLDYSPKRLDRVLKVWKRIKEHDGWRLIIAGDGSDTEFYKDLARNYQLKDVEFLGRTETRYLYEKGQIICISSTYEGFSLVLTEALQHEVIPIAFDSFEAVNDIITSGKNGFLVKPFKLDQYIDILEKLMKDDDLRLQMRHIIQLDISFWTKFDINCITDSWEKLLLQLTKEKSKI